MELHRILKSGGMLYSHFGPIWSTSYGHHLCLLYGGVEYNYHNLKRPSFRHLLSTPADFYNELRKTSDNEDFCRALTDYVFHSIDQNQLMYEDYEKRVEESPFEVVFFKGCDHPEFEEIYPTSFDQIEELKAKYLGYNTFLYHGITMLLRKQA